MVVRGGGGGRGETDASLNTFKSSCDNFTHLPTAQGLRLRLCAPPAEARALDGETSMGKEWQLETSAGLVPWIAKSGKDWM